MAALELRAQLERRRAHVGPGPAIHGDAVEAARKRGQVGHFVAELVHPEQIGQGARGPKLTREPSEQRVRLRIDRPGNGRDRQEEQR